MKETNRFVFWIIFTAALGLILFSAVDFRHLGKRFWAKAGERKFYGVDCGFPEKVKKIAMLAMDWQKIVDKALPALFLVKWDGAGKNDLQEKNENKPINLIVELNSDKINLQIANLKFKSTGKKDEYNRKFYSLDECKVIDFNSLNLSPKIVNRWQESFKCVKKGIIMVLIKKTLINEGYLSLPQEKPDAS